MPNPIFAQKPVKEINCPQCGYPLPIYFQYTKLLECPSCRSTIFLDDEVARVRGDSSALTEEPSLIKLHQLFKFESHSYLPVGKIRYSYGRGFWEEWFLKRNDGASWWLSIDEGDFVLEREVSLDLIGDFDVDNLKIGNFVGDFMVTEIATGECKGFAGELPEPIEIGAKHGYIHFQGEAGELLTLEYSANGEKKLFRGRWIDPFEIEISI